MSFSDNEKIIKSDKLSLQISDTSPDKHWYNENSGWYPITPPDKIWLEFDQIPGASNQTEADNAVTTFPTILEKRTVRLTLDITSNNRAFLCRSIYGDHTSELLGNGILPALVQKNGALSSGYSVRFYHGDPGSGGIELPTTYRSGSGGSPSWEFNYASGIIKVSTDESSHYKSLYDTNGLYVVFYRYVGATGIDSGGGTSDGKSVIDSFNCDLSTDVGDIVYVSTSSDNYVLSNSDNRSDPVSIGIVKNKPFNNVAEVIMVGKSPSIYSGLEKGKNVYLSETGGLTTTLPTTGYLQIIGVAISPTQIIVNPNYRKIRLNPF